jgi:2-succinyl-5-enolpyruvyl-6-hydroxy-3-cyclohexene-1-carboxylate synthase
VEEALDVAVGAFVEELARAGVRHVSACPGSRSTPLAIKLAQSPDLRLWMHLDERSAAFFGLGLARTLDEPVALLATSGTAAANFWPAVVEANLARVPLIVLTADRPHELRDVGAPQTMDQLQLYGTQAKWFCDLPEPELSEDHVRLVRTVAGRAVGTARAEPAGPVHVNWPFREPLVPASRPGAWGRRPTGAPYVAVDTGRLAPSAPTLERLRRHLAEAARPLLICGPQDDPDLPAAVAALAARRGIPVLADPLSGVRRGPHVDDTILWAYDSYLRAPRAVRELQPDLILRLGALSTSKPVLQFLQALPDAYQVVVDPGGWREPTGLAQEVLHVDPRLLCDGVRAGISPTAAAADDAWLARWQDLDRRAAAAFDAGFDALGDEPFEGRVFAHLGDVLPAGAVVCAGNSMPVRDLDSFLPASSRSLRCMANRGANGIDGVVSTALGVSAAGRGPVVLVIGDVSFYHDLNGLLAARQHGLDLLVVVVNNDGGGIFSFLSQAESASIGTRFEQLFGTPHGLDFEPFVRGYGGRWARATDWPAFCAALATELPEPGLRVVELVTARERNVVLHRQLWAAVADAVAPRALA